MIGTGMGAFFGQNLALWGSVGTPGVSTLLVSPWGCLHWGAVGGC